MLYDEHCGMCTALAAWLAEHGKGLSVAPIGSPTGAELLRDLSATERYASVHVVDDAGRRRSAGAAVPVVLATLPAGRPGAAIARRLPWASELGYRLVARHRGTISKLLRLSRAVRRESGRRQAREHGRGGRPES